LRWLRGQIEFLSRHLLELADMRHHLVGMLADTISTGSEVVGNEGGLATYLAFAL